MYTSIPQDGNWALTVDGQPAEITLVGNVMIGVKLSEGQHNVVFSYHNRAFSLGWKISLLCLVLFLTAYWMVYQPKFHRKKGKFEKYILFTEKGGAPGSDRRYRKRKIHHN